MKRSTHWLVADAGIDREKDPNRCEYCGIRMGKEHKKTCVIRKRTVVASFEGTMVVLIPEGLSLKRTNELLLEKPALTLVVLHEALGEAIKAAKKNEELLSSYGFNLDLEILAEASEEQEEDAGIYVNELPS